MDNKIKEQSEAVQDFIEKNLSKSARQLDEIKRALSSGEKRYLEYFWNSKAQVQRDSVPSSVIKYFEAETKHHSLSYLIDNRVEMDLLGLVSKGYLKRTDRATYELTALGVSYLKDAHPRIIVIWDRLLERTPKHVSLLVTLIGLISSVFGIIQYLSSL